MHTPDVAAVRQFTLAGATGAPDEKLAAILQAVAKAAGGEPLHEELVIAVQAGAKTAAVLARRDLVRCFRFRLDTFLPEDAGLLAVA